METVLGMSIYSLKVIGTVFFILSVNSFTYREFILVCGVNFLVYYIFDGSVGPYSWHYGLGFAFSYPFSKHFLCYVFSREIIFLAKIDA